MTVLQDGPYPGETPVEAELKWIADLKKTVQLTNKITRPAEKPDEWFTFQLAAEEKQRLAALAKAKGLSISSWARMCLLAAAEKEEGVQRRARKKSS